MTPTEEQLSIVAAAKSSSSNLIINALAGAAKTSTLVLIAKALGNTAILAICFNKKIQLEMAERLPGNCTAKTLNSLGNAAWKDYLGRWPKLDTGKTYRILKELVESLPLEERGPAYESFSDIMRAIDGGKSAGYIPDGSFPMAKPLMNDDEFYNWLEEEPTPLEWDLIRAASLKSLREAHEGVIDFNDQILCSTVFPCSFPQFPIVLVDEAQDLSSLNHAMLRKLARKRLIAVGDPCQAIYGFRGAHENSMQKLQQEFSMEEFPLTISFRCARAVVEAARFRAPAMQYASWASEGLVTRLEEWSAAALPQNAAIICRNNAPLFSMAIKLLKNGRYPELLGNDIGKNLLKVLSKFGKPTMKQADVLTAIDLWAEKKAKRSRDRAKVEDQADCLRIFATAGPDLGAAIAYAEHIFSASGPIKLMTGHKSKGLEFENVYFLDQKLVGDKGQERNLRYVIITRAKENLYYVETESFKDAE